MSDSLRPYGLQPARLLCPWWFSRQEYRSGLPCPSPGDLPNSGMEPMSLLSMPPGKPLRQSSKWWSHKSRNAGSYQNLVEAGSSSPWEPERERGVAKGGGLLHLHFDPVLLVLGFWPLELWENKFLLFWAKNTFLLFKVCGNLRGWPREGTRFYPGFILTCHTLNSKNKSLLGFYD